MLAPGSFPACWLASITLGFMASQHDPSQPTLPNFTPFVRSCPFWQSCSSNFTLPSFPPSGPWPVSTIHLTSTSFLDFFGNFIIGNVKVVQSPSLRSPAPFILRSHSACTAANHPSVGISLAMSSLDDGFPIETLSVHEPFSQAELDILADLRGILITRTPINRDWDWRRVEEELKTLSDLMGIECCVLEKPLDEFLSSGLLFSEPNRSHEAIVKLPSFDYLASITIPKVKKPYAPSILAAAKFLFNQSTIDSHHIWTLEYNHPLPHMIFQLIIQFAKFEKHWISMMMKQLGIPKQQN
ncbi:hypothetical protein O181_064220 [Austropuccinia psidii MF-1]|uniref:Uncharacterized protein n=1 Tax=Austropuccinia psidii MF-1 TaxID=1389203 RepID=A0A9Q3EK47_9BASI|nr:hypothetical protein [Austropuccinia psidii MF-1]